jgi:hypothetical protein
VNWKIVRWDRDLCRGLVCNGEVTLAFHSTEFSAGTDRWPIVGEPVDVEFNLRGDLLAVFAAGARRVTATQGDVVWDSADWGSEA